MEQPVRKMISLVLNTMGQRVPGASQQALSYIQLHLKGYTCGTSIDELLLKL